LLSTKRDLEFIQEVSLLMSKKFPEMREKFGIWRVHQHFDLAEDEVFHETSDPITRQSTLKIIKKNRSSTGSICFNLDTKSRWLGRCNLVL